MIRFEPAFRLLPLSSLNFLAARTCLGLGPEAAGLPAESTAATLPDDSAAVIFNPAGALAAGPTAPIGRKAAAFLTVNGRGALQPLVRAADRDLRTLGRVDHELHDLGALAVVFQVSTASAFTVGGFW